LAESRGIVAPMIGFGRSAIFVILAVLLVAGCSSWHDGLLKQASFDHKCPREQIQIVRDSGDNMSRTVDVNICGKDRRYRDVGGSRIVSWVDITEQAPAESTQSPDAGK
jgi:hypothetical protein